MKNYRQGDVMMLGVAEIPPDAKQVKRDGRIVLAVGTSKGQAHAIEDAHVELFDRNGTMYLRIAKKEAKLVHDEHRVLKIAPGLYEVRRQLEHTPEAARVVFD